MLESKSDELIDQEDEQAEDTQGASDQAGEQSTEGFDPNNVPPELKDVYKKMQADYTKKTQAVADSRKSVEAKEQQLDDLRLSYEKKLAEKVDAKKDDGIDFDSMTPEQRQAWNQLDKHFEKKLLQREELYKKEIQGLKGHISTFMWSDFCKAHTDADEYKDDMLKIQNKIGGNPSLDDLYLLAKGAEGIKKEGERDYVKRVENKKGKVTSKPSPSGGKEVDDIDFDKGFGNNPARRRNNIMKAWNKAKEKIGGTK